MHCIHRTCRRLSFVWAIVLGLLMAVPSAFAGEPTEFVKRQAEQVDEVLADRSNSDVRTDAFAEIVQEAVDFRELAKRSLGEHWKEQNEENRKQFLELLEKLLRANYKNKITGEKLGQDYEIKYLDEKQRDDRAFVSSRVQWGETEKERKPLDFKLMKKEGGWVIYDLVIDDISLESTYRDSYTEIIEEDGWDALIEKMKERIEELRNEAGEETSEGTPEEADGEE